MASPSERPGTSRGWQESPSRRSSSELGTSRSFHSYGKTPDSYLSELLSYSLDRLKQEPELLKQDSEQRKRQIVETSVTQYEVFLAADRCLESLQSKFDRLNQTLHHCREKFPLFVNACGRYAKESKMAEERLEENRKLTKQREKVSTLLEIPKLMETCVRNGNIDEALDLQSFVHRLGVLHGDLAAVRSLAESAQGAKDLIWSHLNEKLKSNIQLPDALSVVGHLRRLGIYSERELRSCFLSCREQWIISSLSELDLLEPFDFLKRWTDIHRLQLLDVVMQYKAIFTNENERDGGMLTEWALHRIVGYLETLQRRLAEVPDGASLLSLLESAMYCGMSLGRVGLDFRLLLIPIFEEAILNLFKSKLDDAFLIFSMHLETHRWTRSQTKETLRTEANGAGGNLASPPIEISQHLPFALYLNGVLTGFNELRHCAPLRGRQTIERWIQESLEHVADKLIHFATRPFDATQREIFMSACRDFISLLFPYVVSTLTVIYPQSATTIDSKPIAERIERIYGYR